MIVRIVTDINAGVSACSDELLGYSAKQRC
jgi:hypothetical protein